MELRVDVSQAIPGEPIVLEINGNVDLPGGLSCSALLKGTLVRESGVYSAGRYLAEGVLSADVNVPCALCLAKAVFSTECAFNEIFTREPDTKSFAEEWASLRM